MTYENALQAARSFNKRHHDRKIYRRITCYWRSVGATTDNAKTEAWPNMFHELHLSLSKKIQQCACHTNETQIQRTAHK